MLERERQTSGTRFDPDSEARPNRVQLLSVLLFVGVLVVVAWWADAAAAMQAHQLYATVAAERGTHVLPGGRPALDARLPEKHLHGQSGESAKGLVVAVNTPAPDDTNRNANADVRIERIRSTGYSALPPDELVLPPGGTSSSSRLALANLTGTTITVFLTGPANRRVNLRPNDSQALDIPAGDYRIMGVSAGSGRIFFGDRSYAATSSYKQTFRDSLSMEE